jgi:hypothetical protein
LSVIEKSLSRGLVRAETRLLTNALMRHTGELLNAFHDGVIPHFERRSRLSFAEMHALAHNLHDKAGAAFTPVWCDMEFVPPTDGRPQSGSYEMLHYWINPVAVEGTSDRLMKIAVFSAWGNRKHIAMRAHDSLVSFYEHAPRRLLQRCGNLDAAVRAIGERLVEVIILPSLALHESPAALIGTELHIPLLDGLLIGRFLERPLDAVAGDHRKISKVGCRNWTISFPATAQFVVKTYIGAEDMRPRQDWIAHEVLSWLQTHRREAEIFRRYIGYKLGALWDNGHMTRMEFEALRSDFWRMRDRVFGVL